MKGDLIPPDHHVARLCRTRDIIFDDTGTAIGVYESAFRTRPSGGHNVSAYCLEFFRGDREQNIRAVSSIIKAQPRRTLRLAIINVGQLTKYGIRVIEDPIYDPPPNTNVAHVLLDGLQNRQVREAIANLVSTDDLVSLSSADPKLNHLTKDFEEN